MVEGYIPIEDQQSEKRVLGRYLGITAYIAGCEDCMPIRNLEHIGSSEEVEHQVLQRY